MIRLRPRDRAHLSQALMGVTFTGMGLVTMFAPNFLSRLCLTPGTFEEVAKGDSLLHPMRLAVQCFGAQATLGGVVILSSKFTKSTFKTFGLAILPFFYL